MQEGSNKGARRIQWQVNLNKAISPKKADSHKCMNAK